MLTKFCIIEAGLLSSQPLNASSNYFLRLKFWLFWWSHAMDKLVTRILVYRTYLSNCKNAKCLWKVWLSCNLVLLPAADIFYKTFFLRLKLLLSDLTTVLSVKTALTGGVVFVLLPSFNFFNFRKKILSLVIHTSEQGELHSVNKRYEEFQLYFATSKLSTELGRNTKPRYTRLVRQVSTWDISSVNVCWHDYSWVGILLRIVFSQPYCQQKRFWVPFYRIDDSLLDVANCAMQQTIKLFTYKCLFR